jgi:hypothetical protein
MSPAALASAGMASVRSVSSPLGLVVSVIRFSLWCCFDP